MTAATASGVPIVRKWKAAIVLFVIGCAIFRRHLRRAGTGGEEVVAIVMPKSLTSTAEPMLTLSINGNKDAQLMPDVSANIP